MHLLLFEALVNNKSFWERVSRVIWSLLWSPKILRTASVSLLISPEISSIKAFYYIVILLLHCIPICFHAWLLLLILFRFDKNSFLFILYLFILLLGANLVKKKYFIYYDLYIYTTDLKWIKFCLQSFYILLQFRNYVLYFILFTVMYHFLI